MRPRTLVAILCTLAVLLVALAAWLLSVPATLVGGGSVMAIAALAWWARRKAPNGKPSGPAVAAGNPDRESRQT